MTVSGAAAETTVAVTPTVPIEFARSVAEGGGAELDDVEVEGCADMATSIRCPNVVRTASLWTESQSRVLYENWPP
jgi:hypothetical protein